MDLKLAGKRALVTGSTRGLGFATAKMLLSEGASVAINGRSAKTVTNALEELSALGKERTAGWIGDIADHATAARLVHQTAERFGGLDILVTNSGGPPAGPFEQFDDETWQQAVEHTFLGHVRLIRAALPLLRMSEAAAVLAITSYSTKHPLENLILSNSVRLATIGAIKSLAIELGSENIRFNAILPGWTTTERVQNIMESRAEFNRTSVAHELNKQTTAIPMKRMATPEEFANAAAFLVSPAASYINGVMLQVDGGATRGIF